MMRSNAAGENSANSLAHPDVLAGTAPAWLVTLGQEDWEMEIRLIEEGL